MERKNWISKLDDLEGDKPDSPAKEPTTMEFESSYETMILYGLAGAVGLILILVVILFFRTGKDSSFADIQDVYSRLATLEMQVGSMEKREEERQKVFLQFVQSEQDVKARIDSKREALDDLRQKFAQLEKTTPTPAPRPAPAAPAREEPRAEVRQETKPDVQEKQDVIYHEVQRGDNLFRIGLKYNISVDRILQLNNLSPNDSIHPGQKLIVGSKE